MQLLLNARHSLPYMYTSIVRDAVSHSLVVIVHVEVPLRLTLVTSPQNSSTRLQRMSLPPCSSLSMIVDGDRLDAGRTPSLTRMGVTASSCNLAISALESCAPFAYALRVLAT